MSGILKKVFDAFRSKPRAPEPEPEMVLVRTCSKKYIDSLSKIERASLAASAHRIVYGVAPRNAANAAMLVKLHTDIERRVANLEANRNLPRAKPYTCFGCGCVYHDPTKVRRCPRCGRIRYKTWDAGS